MLFAQAERWLNRGRGRAFRIPTACSQPKSARYKWALNPPGSKSRNAIASHALLQLELRATTNEVLGYLETEAGRIIHAAAQMYGVHAEITLVGESIAAPCDPALLDIVEACARDEELATNVVRTLPFNASEDITYMMEAVQKRGGLATYMLFGTELAAGHHNAAFDFREETMPLAVNLYGRVLKRISAKT